MTDEEAVKAIAASNAAMAAAQLAHRELVKRLFPIGSYIRWKEGPYVKAGTVTGYSLTGINLRAGGKTVLIEAIVNAIKENA